MKARAWRQPFWLAAAALLVLTLAAYGQLLDPQRMLADYDAFVYFYPLRAYAAAAVQEGRLPLWNPYSFLGVPFLANPQSALLYPGTWLFFWLPVPQAYGLNIALHVLLAGLAFWVFSRVTLAVSGPAALLGGMTFMLSGVLSGQYGHVNQLSAAAWLPLVLATADLALRRRRVAWLVAAGGLLGLQLLAGHPQQSYMTLLVLGLLVLWRAWPWRRRSVLWGVGCLGLITVLGLGIAAMQLLPTAELARESIRGGGLTYRDAVAGSLWPWLVARALLPYAALELGSTEYLGYVGIVPLVLAVLALGLASPGRLLLPAVLAALGLALALGGANPLYPALYAVVPGLSSFRAPARWLLLYTVGMAGLAAIGLDWLLTRRVWRPCWRRALRLLVTTVCLGGCLALAYLGGERVPRDLQLRWLGWGLGAVTLAAGCLWPPTRRAAAVLTLGVAGLELWLAGGDLPPRRPVPLEAYAQPRDSTLYVQSRLQGGRFLSIASEEYELKEAPDYRLWFADLPEDVVTDFLIAAKRNEVLTPNVNLLYAIEDVDGYDGGLLPLQRYLALATLLVPTDRLRSDGVLISRLDALPPRRVMDLLNVRLVLAGRIKDFVDQGIFYDRSIVVPLEAGQRLDVTRVPRRGFTTLGMISSVEGVLPAPGERLGRLEVETDGGQITVLPLVMGRDTDAAMAAEPTSPTLKLVRPWSWRQDGDPLTYLRRLPLPGGALRRLALVNERPGSVLTVSALTLIDDRDGATASLVLDDRLERTLFFDTKVYEYPGVLERAYLVHHVVEADDAAALALLRNPAFDPRQLAVVTPGAKVRPDAPSGGEDRVVIEERVPERVRLRTQSSSSSLLVLADPFYPGWRATVDGQSAPIVRTNLAFRGVALPAGEHEVVFVYDPFSVRAGAVISGAAMLVMVALLLWTGGRGRRSWHPM